MSSKIQYNLTGGAANANPDLSLGGTGSSVQVSSVALNNIFDNVLPTDISGKNHVTYRAIDFYNYGDATALHCEFWFTDTTNSESVVAAGYDAAGVQSIADDETAPVGITFVEHDTDNRLTLPNLAAGSKHRIWIRRTVDQDADNLNDDTAIMHSWFS